MTGHYILNDLAVSKLKPRKSVWYSREKGLSDTRGMCIAIFPSGSKSFQFQYKSLDKLGKRITLTLGEFGETFRVADARVKAKQYRSEIIQGRDPRILRQECMLAIEDLYKWTLGRYLDERYYSHMQATMTSSERHYKSLKRCFKHWFDLPLQSISVDMVEKWREKRLIKDKVKNQTCNRETGSLRAMLRHAYTKGYIENHPLEKLKKLPEPLPEISEFLEKLEEQRVYDALHKRDNMRRKQRQRTLCWNHKRDAHLTLYPEIGCTNWETPFFYTVFNTGMRRSELFRLNWSWINFTRREIKVVGKGRKGEDRTRYIPINDRLLPMLRQWYEMNNQPKAGLMFPNPDTGKELTDIKKVWVSVQREAGISHFRFHGIRHHVCSWLVMGGVDLVTVMRIMGHSEISTTMRYSHLQNDHKHLAMAVL